MFACVCVCECVAVCVGACVFAWFWNLNVRIFPLMIDILAVISYVKKFSADVKRVDGTWNLFERRD